MTSSSAVYVVAARRSPVARAGGTFKYMRPENLLAQVLQEVLRSVPAFSYEEINDIMIGCATPEAEQGMNVARVAALLAGFSETVPAMTVNRLEASGLESIAVAADRIASGRIEAAIVGAVGSTSWVPASGLSYRPHPDYFASGYESMVYHAGLTAEHVAERWGISREQQDQYALESHQKLRMAREKQEFQDELIPYSVQWNEPDHQQCSVITRHRLLEEDECVLMDSLAPFKSLAPLFKVGGTVTAGNGVALADGAVALILANHTMVRRFGLKPLAQFKSYAVAGLSPEDMGMGPVMAIPRALRQADVPLSQVDWIELHEGFAAQSLAVIKELGLLKTRVNPLGDALALGDPLGVSGALRVVTAAHALRRRSLRYALVALGVSGGMGACALLERTP